MDGELPPQSQPSVHIEIEYLNLKVLGLESYLTCIFATSTSYLTVTKPTRHHRVPPVFNSEIMMPLSRLGHQPLTSHTTNVPQVMPFVNTRFIGAVEDEWQLFRSVTALSILTLANTPSSDCPEDYTIGEPIGFGASSIVYSAIYRPVNQDDSTDLANRIPCALKVLDLDTLPPRSLYLLQRETTLMSLSKHPNVLRVRGSWIAGHNLYIALRLMSKGSAADVMRYGWPGGMQEEVIRCILRQALKGLK